MSEQLASEAISKSPIAISQQVLDDLNRRLEATRWPDSETTGDWQQGIPLHYVQSVCAYWRKEYDWRRMETKLNSFNPMQTTIDGVDIHFLHIRSPHKNALPLIMTHGWPGSIVEFHKVIGPLCDPCQHGGKAEDAFHIVCPSLPGYGFSGKPTEAGWGIKRIGQVWGQLMNRLGYGRYVAQGGDWGSLVTSSMGVTETDHCAAIHINMPIVAPDPDTMDSLTPVELRALEDMGVYDSQRSAYAKQQSTRPQTLAYGLADSPSGQLAWVLEKFWDWTDCGEGCEQHPETILSRDELIDNVMIYWLNNAAASSARLYWESFAKPSLDPIDIPVGCSIFPKELFRCSRRWAEKRFSQLIYWNELDKGGHFAAFEQPEIFVRELQNCFSKVR